LQNVYDYHRQSIYDIIVHQYSDWDYATTTSDRDRKRRSVTSFGRKSLASLLGDALVVAPVVAMATFHSRHSRHGVATYLFEFNQPPAPAHLDASLTGAPGEELLYAFGAPLADKALQPHPLRSYTRTERLLSMEVVRYWSNFAKTGSAGMLLI